MNNNYDPDLGGGRGYSLSFSNQDSYASVQSYFTASNHWPVKEQTFSVWIRYTGISPGGTRSFAFTTIAANDPNHMQLGLNVIQLENNWIPNVQLFMALLVSFTPVVHLDSFATSWTHVTVTYNMTDVSVYYNGTLASHVPSIKQPLRWTDTSALFLGGWVQQQANDANLVSATQSEHFFGWIDDLAFYNRILSVEEISKNWQQAVDTTDSSLFLYYNFDEGPGAAIITNHGSIGSQGDLYNGQVLGSTNYQETNSQTMLPVKQVLFSPGVPVIGASSTLPVVFAVDTGASARLHIACLLTTTTTTTSSLMPSQAQFLSLPSGTGKIYQADVSQTRITSPNTMLTNPASEFWYTASATIGTSPMVDSMQYSCVCNGITQTGIINVIINPAVVPDPTISLVVPGITKKINLHGSLSNPGLMKVNITSLPTLGRLSQWNFENTDLLTLIVKPGTQLTNILNGIQYLPNDGINGIDTFSYQLIHNGMVSNVATVKLSVQSWDFPPIIPSTATSGNPVIIINRQATSINLPVKDNQQKQYLGVYIMSLPTKGTLYQRNPDGSLGAVINKHFQYSFPTPSIQYASKILNVSTFWGTGASWNPIQALGPQDCFVAGSCTKAFGAGSVSGNGGFVKGCGQGLCYASNPNQNYLNFGYTEYIELGYNTSVIVNQLIDGENEGMGAVKNILAKDPLGNWMTLWTTPTVDATIEKLYNKFNQYRYNTPDICQTPFFTNHIRYEIDTRDVPGWNEIDYFELHGLSAVDVSMVNWYGNAKWDVVYVPHKDASGLDSFSYSATDCPGTLRVGFSQRWSPNVGTININIAPVGTAGTAKIDPFKGIAKLDLSIWSVNTNMSTSSSHTNTQALAFTIATLPPSTSGYLRDVKGTAILTAPYSLNDSHVWFNPVPCCTASTCTQTQLQQQQQTNHTSFAYLTSDKNSMGPLTVSLAIVCPSVTINANATPTEVGIPIAIALAVILFVAGIAFGLRQYSLKREAIRQQKRFEREREEAETKHAMHQLEEAAKHAEVEKKKAKAEAEKEKAVNKHEMQLRLELQENIANSAHDMKSPACALSLAVGSLISTFHGKSHIDKDGCKMTMETLKGMLHTLSSLNTIINRSVDAASKMSGNALTPHMDSIDIRQLLGDIMVFMRWQAENSSLKVILETYPEHLPTNIWADLKWLREDLLCVAANALKFSQERSMVPVIVRLTIDTTDNNTMPPMLCFRFIDSGHNLSEDQHVKLFNYPQMRSSDRMGMGGMGLGLYCLRERVTAMGGQCGSRKRCDGLEGTEIWFCIPLLDADANIKSRIVPSTISPKSQAQSLVQQKLEETNATAVEASISRISNTSTFVTALGGTNRCTSSFSSNPSSKSDPIKRDSFDATNDNKTPPSNHDASNALVSNKSKPARKVRKSTDGSPLLTLQQSFDRISEEKGGVTLPILIVDDSISILKMIRRSLLNEIPDLVIKEARDGHEAFDRVQEEINGFHVIITDIQMPNCDGFDFTYRIREYEDRKRLPPTMVIGMSANYQEKIISQSVRCGMDGFLHKPFQLQTLLDVINHVQLHRDLTKQMEAMDYKDSSLLRQQSRQDKDSFSRSLSRQQPTQDKGSLLRQYSQTQGQKEAITASSSMVSSLQPNNLPEISVSSLDTTTTSSTCTLQDKMDITPFAITNRTHNPPMKEIGTVVDDRPSCKPTLPYVEESTEEEQHLASLPVKNTRISLVDDSCTDMAVLASGVKPPPSFGTSSAPRIFPES